MVSYIPGGLLSTAMFKSEMSKRTFLIKAYFYLSMKIIWRTQKRSSTVGQFLLVQLGLHVKLEDSSQGKTLVLVDVDSLLAIDHDHDLDCDLDLDLAHAAVIIWCVEKSGHPLRFKTMSISSMFACCMFRKLSSEIVLIILYCSGPHGELHLISEKKRKICPILSQLHLQVLSAIGDMKAKYQYSMLPFW